MDKRKLANQQVKDRLLAALVREAHGGSFLDRQASP